jgi:hypothetical protein
MKLDTSLLRSNGSKDCNLQATYIPLPCHFASFDETNHFLDFINWKPLYGVGKKEVSNTRRCVEGTQGTISTITTTTTLSFIVHIQCFLSFMIIYFVVAVNTMRGPSFGPPLCHLHHFISL